tara:strand:+ start:2962 stop:3378 length:417 start_codon:yes stop_codon:yes gene_type:complete
MFGSRQRAALQQARQELDNKNSIIEAIRQNLAWIEFSPKGVILDANPAFLDVVGYRLDEVRGQPHSMFCAPQLVASAEYKRFWQRLADGESFSDRFMRQGQGGRSIWLEASYIPIRDAAGRVERVLKLATDITREVQA